MQIDESDLRIDIFRSSGKRRAGISTTAHGAYRICPLESSSPVQNERSQLQGKTRALQVLALSLQAMAEQALADLRRPTGLTSQITAVDRGSHSHLQLPEGGSRKDR